MIPEISVIHYLWIKLRILFTVFICMQLTDASTQSICHAYFCPPGTAVKKMQYYKTPKST